MNTSNTTIDGKGGSKRRLIIFAVLSVLVFGIILLSVWFSIRVPPLDVALAKKTQLIGMDRTIRKGFNVEDSAVNRRRILSGGVGKDVIPALTNPAFLGSAAANYLKPADRVIGIKLGDDARAYPIRIMNHHEVVNDTVNETPVAVTFCPLCDSALVFDRRTPLGEREFGVSGLVYNSNVLIYDRGSDNESLWSQMSKAGITSNARDKSLDLIPFELTTWKEWKSRNPNTQVLSLKTGHDRDYDANPYDFYINSNELLFPVEPENLELPDKMRVLGVYTEKSSRAYPQKAFSKDRLSVTEQLDGKSFTVTFNPDTGSLRVSEADDGIHWVYSYWFAWYAFHPETTVFE